MRFGIQTSRREVFVDVTASVAEAVRASGISDGVAFVSSPHTTAGVTINENADPDVTRDLIHGLGRISPTDGGWRHGEGNSDAHLKAALIGTSAMVPISGGRLALGTWQAVYFAEFDGPRSRSCDVVIVPGVG